MLTGITGLINGEPWPAVGEIADLPDAAAAHAVEAGHAEYVEEVADGQSAPEPGPEPVEEPDASTAVDSDPEPTAEPKPVKKSAKKRTKKS